MFSVETVVHSLFPIEFESIPTKFPREILSLGFFDHFPRILALGKPIDSNSFIQINDSFILAEFMVLDMEGNLGILLILR